MYPIISENVVQFFYHLAITRVYFDLELGIVETSSYFRAISKRNLFVPLSDVADVEFLHCL